MRRHLSYYFWRVAIGVTIGLILMTAKAHALSIQFEPGSPVKIFNSSQHFHIAPLGNEQTIQYSLDIPYSNTDYDFVMFQLTEIITDSYGFSNTSSTARVYDVIGYTYYMWIFYSDNTATNCFYQDSVFVCPLDKNKTMSKIQFRFPPFNASQSITGDLDIYFTAYCTPLKNTFNSMSESSSQTAQNTKETNDLIKSDDIGDDSGHASTFASWQSSSAQNGTITNLITLPITLYTSILNNINGTCSSFSLGSLYGSSLTMTCIQPSQYLGSTLWGVIDMLFSGFFIFVISKKMIKVFNNMSMLKEGDILD